MRLIGSALFLLLAIAGSARAQTATVAPTVVPCSKSSNQIANMTTLQCAITAALSPTNGNIILFSNVTNVQSTGLVQIGNKPSWVPAPGIVACPGAPPRRSWVENRQIGGFPALLNPRMEGYFQVEDWLNRVHYIPAC